MHHKHHQANGESQCESTLLAGRVSRITTSNPEPLLHVSQPETPLTGQPRHETIFRPRDKPVHHVPKDNFTVLNHLREKLRPRSSLSKP